MIIQLGALFSGLVSGLGGIARQLLPVALETGSAFLQRELGVPESREAGLWWVSSYLQALHDP